MLEKTVAEIIVTLRDINEMLGNQAKTQAEFNEQLRKEWGLK